MKSLKVNELQLNTLRKLKTESKYHVEYDIRFSIKTVRGYGNYLVVTQYFRLKDGCQKLYDKDPKVKSELMEYYMIDNLISSESGSAVEYNEIEITKDEVAL